MSDEKLESLVSDYAELAKDKNIDTAALLENALTQDYENRVSTKAKRWAYLISIGIPLSGFLFGIYYYASDKSDGKQTAYVCMAITVISLIFTIIMGKALLGGAGVTPQQIQQIKPSDIQQLTQ